ncbi:MULTISPECIES: LacI family DNA-binding transcriptional regulator [unclassified Leifsonia]|uniref:LacI family DNA-binding transcriptional regulator n=1 Tax=unclassified Leifsonia TaxID=2663824 RepID=UPI001CBE6ECF|nr:MULTISPECIES: LacI family DNA-binding transcriptional regulator [unclassified Leifsonia]
MASTEARESAPKPPGMTDVARVAGVSAQTVSRALSGHPNVQEKTRAKVLAAVEQLGYRMNNAARMLSSGHSRTIGIVLLQTSFFSRTAVTVGVEEAARDAGYSVSSATSPSLEPTAIEEAMSRLADQGVEGIILALPLIHVTRGIEELTRAIPTITIDGSRTSSTEIVAVDQSQAARLATQHLLDLGHKTVWHVSGPTEWLDAMSRSEGWRSTLEAAGITPPPELKGDWSPASGYQNGLILARIPEVTAVFVSSDEMAFGVIRAFHELGRRIPEDISVVGVDDITLAEYCSPSLTTVAQPFGEMGRLAVEHLLRYIADPHTTLAPASVEPTLVVRASTAAAPATA